MRSDRLLVLIVLLFCFVTLPLNGQQSFMDEPGIPAFTTAFPVDHGFINLANGNLHLEIPIAAYAQRGNPKALNTRLVYDSRLWMVRTDPVTQARSWAPSVPSIGVGVFGGFRLITDGESGSPTFSQDVVTCGFVNGQPRFKTTYSGYSYQEPSGTFHRTANAFKLINKDPSCTGPASTPNGSAYAVDNSGFKIVVTNYTSVTVYAPDGSQVFPVLQDTNGNFYSTAAGQNITFRNVVDTLGRIPVVPTFSGNQIFLDYLCLQGCNPSNGDRTRVTINFSSPSWATQFNQSGVGEYSGPGGAIDSIVFPDGGSYHFQYDSYGQITSITLPTGGQATYGYTNFTDYQGNVNRWVTSRVADGQSWSFTPLNQACSTAPCPMQVTVTTPPYNDGTSTASDTRVYLFSVQNQGTSSGSWNTQIQYFRGAASGSPILTKNTDYGLPSTCPATPGFSGIPVVIRDTLTWPAGSGTLSKKAEYCYDTFSNRTVDKEWDYQPNGNFAANPDREVDNVYVTDANYVGANLIRLLKSSTTLNNAGAMVAQRQYGYDETALQPTSVATHHLNATGPRGNLTSDSKWLNTTNTLVTNNTKWYDTGELYQVIDPLGHSATFSYDVAFAGAYITSSCNALSQCSFADFDFNSGRLTSSTDANGSGLGDPAHTTTYTFDTMLRPLCTTAADGGQSCLSYPNVVTTSKTIKVTPTLNNISSTILDGFGRNIQKQQVTPNGTSKVDTTYDPAGGPSTVSNPYFTTADATYGVTQSFHDALGRTTTTVRQDGGVSSSTYSVRSSGTANSVCGTGTDEAGKKRVVCHNGFGELVEVDEPGAPSPGVQARGSIDIGPIKTAQVGGTTATPASAQVTISGNEHFKTTIIRCTPQQIKMGCEPSSFTTYDNGKVFITVGGHEYDYFFSGSDTSVDTSASVAQGLVLAIQSDPARIVNAAAPQGGTVITLSAIASGSNGNGISFATGYTWNTTQFPTQGASFTASPTSGALAGGQNGVPPSTLTDHGTVTITAGPFTTSSISYGPGTANLTAASVATALANALSVPGSGVTATTNGGTVINVIETAFGVSGNGVGVSTHPVSADPTDFPSPSFSVGSSSLSGGVDPDPSGLTLPFVTQYQYDALGNLLRVDQKGSAPSDSTLWRTRTFTYDSLSRLLSATNPESGTITYSYDLDGLLLQKTSPQANVRPPATGSTTISNCYDALHRVTGRAYTVQTCQNGHLPQGTEVVSYSYDAGTNGISKLTSITDQAGSTSYSYDKVGRTTIEQRTIAGTPNITKSVAYSYNLDGSLKTLTYPSNAVVTYTPWNNGTVATGEPSAITDTGNGINYISNGNYQADGQFTAYVSGGLVANAFSYNKRLQPVNISATFGSPVQTVLSISYDFHLGNGDNGNVFSTTNNKDTGRSQIFSYDLLNRLISAQNTGTDCSVPTVNGKTKFWGNNYDYDAWGNLLSKTVTKCSAESLGIGAGPNNQVQNGFIFDIAGNLVYDPTPGHQLNYTYDAENRTATVSDGATTTLYGYDGNSARIQKSSGSIGTLFWYSSLGVVAESDLAGTIKSEYIFFDGKRVARRDLTAPTGISYYFSDHLKTADVITDASGNIKAESDYYPWGGELQFVNNDSNDYKFTGQKRDLESGLDYFGARYYSSALGRFNAIDPVALSRQKVADPQQLNMYSYARDNPLRFIDPDGEIIRLRDLTEDQRNKLIAELERDTGLQLKYNKDTGNLEVVSDPSKAKGGSATYRKDLISAINNKDTFNVISDPKVGAGGYDPATKTVHIDFSFANEALTLGIVFYHEAIGHGLYGYGDPESSSADDTQAFWDILRGHSAFQLEQKVAEELGIPVRDDYSLTAHNGRYFIKVREPQSEYKKRAGWFTWKKHWEIDVTDSANKMPK